ncbi:hypothetical protein E2562_032453 [Oryza meyeriana var. granulata]|uniref:Potassium transporter n=1 Tax=Oryza meyeriana var. granulata TaxID=110450 RepID=A0A6G1FEN7_9ORYZ|nr:hypothetical protein E2562_032453 [Oryza meyeriana var. granulata]
MLLCIAIITGLRDTTLIGNAYGMACAGVMLVTTLLMALVILFVWQYNCLVVALFLAAFDVVETVYLLAVLRKVPQGGWLPLVLSLVFVVVMYVWHYGTRWKHLFDMQNKVSLKWIHVLGPSLNIVRVPGMGLIYTELAIGVPAIFSHFVTNLLAFHQVLVFICVKAVPVPQVHDKERHLIRRISPRDWATDATYKCYRGLPTYGGGPASTIEGNTTAPPKVSPIAFADADEAAGRPTPLTGVTEDCALTAKDSATAGEVAPTSVVGATTKGDTTATAEVSSTIVTEPDDPIAAVDLAAMIIDDD